MSKPSVCNNMKTFSGWQWLLIDCANHAGFDKLTFEDRISWAEQNLTTLESYRAKEQWKEKPLYQKSVMAIREAEAGHMSHHMVGVDAVCSGMQLMACLTNCFNAGLATGLVDPNARADAYTDCSNLMSGILGKQLPNQREAVKKAVMRSLYGSKREPIRQFGDETPELAAFYSAINQLAPGPWNLLQALIDSWQPYQDTHSWVLPDTYQALVRNYVPINDRLEIDELNHHRMTYRHYVHKGEKRGVKNAANVIHSVDAWVLRSLVRRCNYDREKVENAVEAITAQLIEHAAVGAFAANRAQKALQSLSRVIPGLKTQFSRAFQPYWERYEKTGLVDVSWINVLERRDLDVLPLGVLRDLNSVLTRMLEYPPFEIVTVHDDFKCHANHVDVMRGWYREILAEIADSDLVHDLLSQVYGTEGQFSSAKSGLSTHIRQSNYGLC